MLNFNGMDDPQKPKQPEPMPDPVRAPKKYHEWILKHHVRKGPNSVKGVKRDQFHRQFQPNNPSFSPELVNAVETGDWTGAKDHTRRLRDALNSTEGLYETTQGKPSNHEFVLRDIFLMLNIDFDYQVPYTYPNGEQIVVDFYFPSDGRYFEVFGFRREESYRDDAYTKATKLKSKLWWLDLMKTFIRSGNVNLLTYANMLDKNVCHRYNCSLSLFTKSVVQMLTKTVPLLGNGSLSMVKNYLIQMGMLSTQEKRDMRDDIDVKPPQELEAPSYYLPDYMKKQRPMVHPLKPASSAGFIKTAAPNLDEITASLKSQYQSVDEWSDECKVAVYFRTPDRLRQAMSGMQSGELRMVASNWYDAMKMAAPKTKGCVTFDFDRTLTLPHMEGHKYLFYGVQPNLPMIEKFKEYKRRGYTVGIVTSRPKRYENPGSTHNLQGERAIAVEDFVKKYNIPADFIHYTHWHPKAPLLKEIGSQLHHDDDRHECERCRHHGIETEHIEHESDAENGY